MKSPSNQQTNLTDSLTDNSTDNLANHPANHPANSELAQLVNTALDQSVNNLSAQAVSDIAQARHQALLMAKNNRQKVSLANQIQQSLFPRVAIPVAAALIVAVLVNHNSVEPVPVLPLAMVTSDIPTEELTLLEDLEFVTWLAENEQDVLL